VWIADVTGSLTDMVVTKATRHQFLDRFTNQIFTGKAEEAFGLCVHQGDPPVSIDHYHGIWSRLE
jgi:hypothetical protein